MLVFLKGTRATNIFDKDTLNYGYLKQFSISLA